MADGGPADLTGSFYLHNNYCACYQAVLITVHYSNTIFFILSIISHRIMNGR